MWKSYGTFSYRLNHLVLQSIEINYISEIIFQSCDIILSVGNSRNWYTEGLKNSVSFCIEQQKINVQKVYKCGSSLHVREQQKLMVQKGWKCGSLC